VRNRCPVAAGLKVGAVAPAELEHLMEKTYHTQSIRWRLPATYAAIALLTAIALGIALLVPMREYYMERERVFLAQNAQSIADALGPVLSSKQVAAIDLNEQIRFLALLSQTRVRLLGPDRELQMADSGVLDGSRPSMISYISVSAPAAMDNVFMGVRQAPETLPAGEPFNGDLNRSAPTITTTSDAPVEPSMPTPSDLSIEMAIQPTLVPEGKAAGVRLQFVDGSASGATDIMNIDGSVEQINRLMAVIPLEGTMYGFALQSEPEPEENYRSDQVYLQTILGVDREIVGWVELSEGPAYGREIVTNVARGWLAASLIAILLAGTVGLLVSRRMTTPLLSLTNVARRMATGDLSARADIHRVDEIGSLGRAFNEMANRVEITVGTLAHFASDAAHELQTPLTALHTNLELAQTSADPREYLARAAEQVARLEHLTRDLLDLSRIEGGGSDPEPARLDLARLVGVICEPFAAQAEQAGIDFRLVLPPGPAWVVGQESRLAQALANLVENALKFTPSGGWVEVGLAVEEGRAALWVEDSGIGIAPEDLPGLFQRFHRGRNAAGYPGSGLGLSIVKAVVSAHGGAVKAVSDEGRTRFTLEIPAVDGS